MTQEDAEFEHQAQLGAAEDDRRKGSPSVARGAEWIEDNIAEWDGTGGSIWDHTGDREMRS